MSIRSYRKQVRHCPHSALTCRCMLSTMGIPACRCTSAAPSGTPACLQHASVLYRQWWALFHVAQCCTISFPCRAAPCRAVPCSAVWRPT
jgi:hypothetical protein